MAWNRPTSNTGNATSSSRPSGRGKMPRLHRGLLAGVIVVLGAVTFFMFSGGDVKPKAKSEKSHAAMAIKEVKPVAVTNVSHVESATTGSAAAKETYNGVAVVSHTYVTNRTGMSVREIIKTADGKSYGRTTRFGGSKFKHGTDQLLEAVLFPSREGRDAPLPPMDGAALDRMFRASLKDPIVVQESDVPDVVARKEAVRAAREEIKQMMANGKTFLEILQDQREQNESDAELRLEVKKGLQEVRKSGGSTADEIVYLSAANALLESKGVEPVENESFVRRKGTMK